MDMTTLIDKITKARTKDDLEALGIEHLDINVDKRENKEVIRAKLLGYAEDRLNAQEQGGEPEPASEPEVAGEPAEEPQAETVTEIHPEPASEPQEPQAPAPEPQPVKQPETTGYKGKLGRNKRTGRLIPWTPEMAKYSHMEEVG